MIDRGVLDAHQDGVLQTGAVQIRRRRQQLFDIAVGGENDCTQIGSGFGGNRNSGVLPGLGSEPQRQRCEIRGGVLGLNAVETDSGHVLA